MLEGLDVNIKVGYAHNHQSNPVERFHRTLWALLRAKKMNGVSDWERSLPALLLAYNATQHNSTLCSPSRIFLGRELNLPYLSLLPKFKPENASPPSPNLLEEELDWIIDLMRNSDAVRIRRQFKSYSGLAQDMQPGDKVYAAVLPPPGNSRKLQIKWSGPLVITEVVNEAMIKIQELNVKNPKTYIAHRSKLRLAKKMGQKVTDPLFWLPRLPKDEMDQISQELEEFELPGRANQDVIDEFYQENEFYQKIHKSQRKDDSKDDSMFASSSISSRTRASEDRISENRSSDEMDEFV